MPQGCVHIVHVRYTTCASIIVNMYGQHAPKIWFCCVSPAESDAATVHREIVVDTRKHDNDIIKIPIAIEQFGDGSHTQHAKNVPACPVPQLQISMWISGVSIQSKVVFGLETANLPIDRFRPGKHRKKSPNAYRNVYSIGHFVYNQPKRTAQIVQAKQKKTTKTNHKDNCRFNGMQSCTDKESAQNEKYAPLGQLIQQQRTRMAYTTTTHTHFYTLKEYKLLSRHIITITEST